MGGDGNGRGGREGGLFVVVVPVGKYGGVVGFSGNGGERGGRSYVDGGWGKWLFLLLVLVVVVRCWLMMCW